MGIVFYTLDSEYSCEISVEYAGMLSTLLETKTSATG
jgi:hypothetical protein